MALSNLKLYAGRRPLSLNAALILAGDQVGAGIQRLNRPARRSSFFRA